MEEMTHAVEILEDPLLSTTRSLEQYLGDTDALPTVTQESLLA